LIIIEVVLLILIGIKIVGVEAVEDYVEVVGNQEIVYFRNEITGDPPLLALIILAVVGTFASKRLRREPTLLVAVQVSTIGLIVFVMWPLAQVFIEGFRASQSAEGYSLVQFQKLLTTPMVAKASANTMKIGAITSILATVIGTLVAYTLTLTDVPWKSWMRTLTILPLVSPPFAVSFAFILLFGRRGVITYDLLHITGADIYGPQGIIMVQLISDAFSRICIDQP
jgi:ABC-type sulfate transport system permease component